MIERKREEVLKYGTRKHVRRSLTFFTHVDPRQVGLPIAVLALVGYFSYASDVFLSGANLRNVVLQMAALACVSIGQTFVIVTAGLDLSVGSTVALVSVASALGFASHGIVAGFIFGFVAGVAVGVINGLVVTRLYVPPFIATLAMLSIASGVALTLSGGTPVRGLPDAFVSLAYQPIIGIPIPGVIAVLLLVFAYVIFHKLRLGRYIYAIGGNREAARLSGINAQLVETTAYVICSIFTVFGALILTARVASGQPNIGSGLALMSVAAVVLGGVSLYGGRGSVISVAAGVVFIAVLRNGLNLLGVSSYTQLMVIGVALILAVAWDQYVSGNWFTRGDV